MSQVPVHDPIASATTNEQAADTAALKTLEGLRDIEDDGEGAVENQSQLREKPQPRPVEKPVEDAPKEPADKTPVNDALPDDIAALAEAFGLNKDRIAKRVSLFGEDEVREALRQEFAHYDEQPKPTQEPPVQDEPKETPKPDPAPMHDPELDRVLGKVGDEQWQKDILDYVPSAQPLLDAVKTLAAQNRALTKQMKEITGNVGMVHGEMMQEKAAALSDLFEANAKFYGDPTDPNPTPEHMNRRRRLNFMVGSMRAKSGRTRSFSSLVNMADRYIRAEKVPASAPKPTSNDEVKRNAVRALRGDVVPRSSGGGGKGGSSTEQHENDGVNIWRRAGWR